MDQKSEQCYSETTWLILHNAVTTTLAIKGKHLWVHTCVHMKVCTDVLILDEGILVDGLNDISEQNLGGQRVSMVNHRLSVWAVPTVNCGLI